MSAIQNVQAPPLPSITTDFGHSPVGKLGQAVVVEGKPSFPKAVQNAFHNMRTQFKNLGDRIALAMKPASVRANVAFNKSLSATSEKIGDLIGALSKTQTHLVDGGAFQQAISDLEVASAGVRERGVDYGNLVRARLQINIGKMSLEQLFNLQAGVAMAENSALKSHDTAKGYVSLIKTLVHEQLDTRMKNAANEQVLSTLRKAMDAAQFTSGSPAEVCEHFEVALNRAENIIREYRLEGDVEKLSYALVKHTLEQTVKHGGNSLVAPGKMLEKLATETLQKLADETLLPRQEVPFAMERVVTGSIGNRMGQMEDNFKAAADILLGVSEEDVMDDPRGPIQDPVGFAGEIIKAYANATGMEHHGNVHGMISEPDATLKGLALSDHLEKIATPENMNLAELSVDLLKGLREALTGMGVDGMDEAIQTELETRKETAINTQEKALSEVFSALKSGKPEEIMGRVKAWQVSADSVLNISEALGEDYEGGDGRMTMRNTMLDGAIAKLDIETQQDVLKLLTSSKVVNLKNGVSELGAKIMSRPEHNLDGSRSLLGGAMMDLGVNLDSIEDRLCKSLTEKGLEVGRRSADMEDEGIAGLDVEARKALMNLYQVEPTADNQNAIIRGGQFSKTHQEMFERALAVPLSESEKKEQLLPSSLGTGVSGPFWRDLTRANYQIENSEGEGVPILDRDARVNMNEVQKVEQSLDAIQQLRDLVDGDEGRLMFISQYTHQGLLAGLEMVKNSPDSPLRMPDGTPGSLGGDESTTYTFSKKDNGDIVMRCDYTIKNGFQFFASQTGERLWTTRDKSSAEFSFEVTFKPGNQIVVSEPVTFQSRIQADSNWPKPYPRPITYKAVADDMQIMADFMVYAKAQMIEEGPEFMMALAEFKKNPTREGALQLLNDYMLESAPDSGETVAGRSPVNITGDQLGRVRDGLNAEGGENLSPQELVALFEPAESHLNSLLTQQVRLFTTNVSNEYAKSKNN